MEMGSTFVLHIRFVASDNWRAKRTTLVMSTGARDIIYTMVLRFYGILQNAECACSTFSLENITGEGERHANRLELY